MKRLLINLKKLSFLLIFSIFTVHAVDNIKIIPKYDTIYRSDRIGDSYHFLLLTKSGKYYYLYTNRTSSLTSSELKSSKLLQILKKKQSWGQSFPKKGEYTIDDHKFYTKLLWDQIKILSPKKIKYLNKTLYLK